MRTCSYASDRSIFDLIFALAMSSRIRSWSGNGVTSFNVFSLRCLPSTTVRNAIVFLWTHSIGAAWSTWIGSHHPARVYRAIFSISSGFKESGHLGEWYLYLLFSSIMGILWFTSLNGGSRSGAPFMMSSLDFIHSSRNHGMSSLI